MALSLAVFLVRILHVDLFVHEKLFIHAFDRFVGGLKRVVGYEAEPFRDTGFVSCNLGSRNQVSKRAEGIVERLLVHHTVQITNKQLRAHLDRFLLIRRRLIHSDGFSIQPDLIHDASRILGILLRDEFHKTEPLMRLGDSILREMYIHYSSSL
jgi:hypothetical protein